MKMKVHFVLGENYPNVVGGMEIFNYYLIKNLLDKFEISYSAISRLNYEGARWFRTSNIRPTKFLYPIQVFFQLLFHRDIRKVVLSYSEAHWILWKLYAIFMRILHVDYYIVIHHGKKPTTNHLPVYLDLFSHATKVVAVSEDIKRNYDDLFHLDCQVVYPLVPFEKCKVTRESLRLKYHIPSDRTVFCQIGTVKQMKNPDSILKAVNSMTDEQIKTLNPHIVYAGSGPMFESLKTLAADLVLADRVSFLGFVPKEIINEVYELSDIYVIASDFEGTSVSLLEAMFNKKPILASRAPGIVNTLNESEDCLMFEPRSHEDLKSKIFELVNHPSLASKYRDNVYKHYEKEFSYQGVLDSYSQIFLNV